MMRQYFRKYLQQHREQWSAWQWVNANDDRMALDAMFLLNRMAKGSSAGQTTIYALKNRLVRNLYERGFCIAATLHRQVFECWDCDGTGEDQYEYGEACQKCGGTGIYREYTLYQFVFRVCGKTYVWHQPEKYVDWPVILTDPEIKPFHDGDKADSRSLSYDLMFLYGYVVRAYLLKHGVPRQDVPHLYGLRQVAQDILRDNRWYWRAQYKWKQLRRRGATIHKNARRLWTFLGTGKLPDDEPEWDNPF